MNTMRSNLQSTFNSNPVSGYASDYIGKTITGATSGVKATVIGFDAATTTDPLTLYVKYTQTGTDNVSTTFSDNEELQANGVVGGIVANSSSAQLQATSATATGSSANVEEVCTLFVVSLFVSMHKELFLTSITILHHIVLVFRFQKH